MGQHWVTLVVVRSAPIPNYLETGEGLALWSWLLWSVETANFLFSLSHCSVPRSRDDLDRRAASGATGKSDVPARSGSFDDAKSEEPSCRAMSRSLPRRQSPTFFRHKGCVKAPTGPAKTEHAQQCGRFPRRALGFAFGNTKVSNENRGIEHAVMTDRRQVHQLITRLIARGDNEGLNKETIAMSASFPDVDREC